MNTHTRTPLVTQGTIYATHAANGSPDQSVLLGLTLILPGHMDQAEAVSHIQDLYFDALCSSGFFRLMSKNYTQFASIALIENARTEGGPDYPSAMFDESVYPDGDNTAVDLLFCQLSFESDVEEELRCTTLELQEAMNNNVILGYTQFPLIGVDAPESAQ